MSKISRIDAPIRRPYLSESGIEEFEALNEIPNDGIPQEQITKEQTEFIKLILLPLNREELKLLEMRYGLGEYEEHSLKELSVHYGINSASVRQRIAKVMTKLRSSIYRRKIRDVF